MKKLFAAAGLGAAALGLGACSSSPSGYNNPATLEHAINANASKVTGDPADTTAHTTCVANGSPNLFNCSTRVGENGILYGTYSATVTVNSAGTSWVGSNEQSDGN